MHPTENKSTLQLYLLSLFVFRISGATYPGVPHFGNKYLMILEHYITYQVIQKLLIQNPLKLKMNNHFF